MGGAKRKYFWLARWQRKEKNQTSVAILITTYIKPDASVSFMSFRLCLQTPPSQVLEAWHVQFVYQLILLSKSIYFSPSYFFVSIAQGHWGWNPEPFIHWLGEGSLLWATSSSSFLTLISSTDFQLLKLEYRHPVEFCWAWTVTMFKTQPPLSWRSLVSPSPWVWSIVPP